MSFPPQRPMGMPPMPPGMMPSYGYTPMGMMPMGMNMMPPMVRPGTTTAGSTGTTNAKPSRKLIPQEIPKDDKEDKPPATTVFIGNISERAPDAMIRQMLQRCGNVLSWKRVQGASGKLQAFGFCEYEDPEATLRCIRLLNDWKICEKNLVAKVDAKTKTLLDEYKAKKASRDKKEEDGEIDELDEFIMREDRVAQAGLEAIMREYSADLAKDPPTVPGEDKKEKKKEPKKEKEKDVIKDQGLDDMELEEEEKELINREIHKFRDAHKDEEPEDKETRDREMERRRKREEQREMEKRERERERLRREREERERARERERTRSRSRERSMSRERERERERERRERDRDRELEDEEELYERRKLERKLREKESAYQERLKNWETRERKKTREYEKEKDKEEERKQDEMREARRLREFLEDYIDDRDDPKYYKGSALQRRLKEREKEIEADSRDRQREKEELEEVRRKLEEEGRSDIEEEIAKLEREQEEHLMPRMPEVLEEEAPEVKPEPVVEPKPIVISQPPPPQPIIPANDSTQSSVMSSPDSDNDAGPMFQPMASEDSNSQLFGPAKEDQQQQKLGFASLKLGSERVESPSEQQKKKLTVRDVFNQEEDEQAKRRKLVPLDYGEEEQQGIIVPSKPTTAEEKRRMIKGLIERIPTGKQELFNFSLDWEMVDTTLMDKRIKPWVNKKIVEYIGEEEPTLTNFICQKVIARTPPQQVLTDIAMVLDEEAEVFVVKMWRLLIYETEAKKLGLVK